MFWPYLQICGFQSKYPVEDPSFESKFPVQDKSFQSKLPVENLSPSTSFKFQIKVKDLYWSCEQTVKKTANSPTKLTMNRSHAKKQMEINSTETRRTKFSRNDPYLKHRVANDKYDNIIFHVDNHCQELWYQSHNMQLYN